MNYEEYTKSTNQNCVDPTEWNGTNLVVNNVMKN